METVMFVAAVIGDTRIELEDDRDYTHEDASAMITTVAGEALNLFQAALHVGEASTRELG